MPAILSVITINYNNLAGLKRTVASALQQTARAEIEFIVIDGGSTDGGAEYLREVVADIDVLVIEKDKGLYDAMNKGLKRASAPYVWFVNSGDIIYDNAVAAQVIELAAASPDIIFGDTMITNQQGNDIGLMSKLKPQILPSSLHPGSFRFGMSVCHQSFIVKKACCSSYDLQYRQVADIDWVIQILKKNPSYVRFPGVIAGFEQGGTSAQNEKRAWKERYAVLKKHYGWLPNVLAHAWIIVRRVLFKMKLWNA
jgi:glycosyltransferase involved in cell wall biosynthesis